MIPDSVQCRQKIRRFCSAAWQQPLPCLNQVGYRPHWHALLSKSNAAEFAEGLHQQKGVGRTQTVRDEFASASTLLGRRLGCRVNEHVRVEGDHTRLCMSSRLKGRMS